MTVLKSICVYCGSRKGPDDSFVQLAKDLGHKLAKENIQLIYGGGSVGLMGVIANAVADKGGIITGYIPEHLDRAEISFTRATQMHVVPNMHVRKFNMFRDSDAFVVMPGGLGTLDEVFEMITWRQLGLHTKPIILLNHQNYWAPFKHLVDHVIRHEFASPENTRFFRMVNTVEDVIPAIHKMNEELP